MKFAIAVVSALAAAGCLQSNIHGATNGSPVGASSTGGRVASTAGTSGSAAAGSSSATGSGASGSTGATTGAGTATGGCLGFGQEPCTSNDQCCSGSCLNVCREPIGHACLTNNDCSSANCVNDQCACTTPELNQQTYCASDADCCGGIPCHFVDIPGNGQYGLCCSPIGASCQGNWDCCDSNCVNGTCSCLDVDTEGCEPGDCCKGACNVGVCLNGPGDPCVGPWACLNSNCVNGFCGTCSGDTGGVCSTNADCCVGGVCAENLTNHGQFGFGGPAVDAGLACCGAPGSSCDGGDNSNACCGQCTNGLCACAGVADECFNSQSCCAGEACMTRVLGGEGPLACCQMEGQFCLSQTECCSGNCQDQSCACVPDGGACGAVGFWSPEGPAACCSGACGDAGACL